MDLKDIMDSVDIVEYISQYVDLTQRGSEYWGLSPFKSEKTPSFSVRRETNSWYDFSSGLGGNIITFIKYYFNVSSRDAVNMLKKYVGYDGVLTECEKLTATLICKKFARPKQNKKECVAKPLPDNYMDRYEKRIDKLQVWLDEGISMDSLEKFDVRYDGFSNRLVYPIKDQCGRIINVGGRTLDNDWKEKGIRNIHTFKNGGA